MKLYSYWRSSSSWRVRIALNLKGLSYTYVPVNLLEAEQCDDAHVSRNPMGRVPVLELDDGTMLRESLAIIDYLDQTHPEPAFWPADPVDRARVTEMTQIINSGIQPLQNLAILVHLESQGVDRKAFGARYNQAGLTALEAVAQSQRARGDFMLGTTPTVADICLPPQLYSARRFEVDLSAFPRLLEVEARIADIPAFAEAHPDRQPDAVR